MVRHRRTESEAGIQERRERGLGCDPDGASSARRRYDRRRLYDAAGENKSRAWGGDPYRRLMMPTMSNEHATAYTFRRRSVKR